MTTCPIIAHAFGDLSDPMPDAHRRIDKVGTSPHQGTVVRSMAIWRIVEKTSSHKSLQVHTMYETSRIVLIRLIPPCHRLTTTSPKFGTHYALMRDDCFPSCLLFTLTLLHE
jgi:hypothetical protein